MKRLSRLQRPVTSAVITPRSSHLPQVVEISTSQTWFSFWLRATVSAWHLGVLGLFAPFEARNARNARNAKGR